MSTKKCKHCQKEIDAKATKCPHCQSDLRSWFRRHPILTGLFVFIIFILVVSAGSSSDKKGDTNQGTNSTIEQQAVSEEVGKPQGEVEEVVVVEDNKYPHFKDGTHLVGEDIESGTYRAKNPSSSCYYARLSGLSGSLNEILANDNTGDPAVVTILEGDKAFQSRGCGTWTQDLSAITSDTTTFDDGILIVRTDIEPGTYRNKGQTGCYYARLKDFTGGLGSILANNNTDDQAIVTILATDKGFKSTSCGTWEKVE
jgi:hypothetical protein